MDLDGTTLRSDNSIAQENIDAIAEALDMGHYVTVATGRALVSARPIIQKLGMLRRGCFMISFNGALIYDLESGAVLDEHLLPDEYASYLFSEAERAGLYMHAYNETGFLVREKCPESDFYLQKTGTPCNIVPDLYEKGIYHTPKVLLLAIEDQTPLYDFQEQHRAWESGKCVSTFSFAEMLEYMDCSASKGQGVQFLADYLGVRIKNTIAIGDADNDISMLQAAGCGVAMKNASDHVKESADCVTEHDNDGGGVAETLRRFA